MEHLHSVKGPDVRVVDGLTMMKIQRVHLFHLNLQRNKKNLISTQNESMTGQDQEEKKQILYTRLFCPFTDLNYFTPSKIYSNGKQ